MNIKNAILSLFTIITLTSYSQNVNLEWVKSIGGKEGDIGISIEVDSDGNIYSAGEFQDTVDFDPGLGSYNLIGGNTPPPLSGITQTQSIYISKLDANGNFVWAKSILANFIRMRDMVIDVFGNVYTIGTFNGTVDFDPGFGTYNLTSNTTSGIYILKLDSSGNFLWAKNFEGRCNSIFVDLTCNVYTTGAFSDTVDFDPGPSNYYLSADTNGNTNSFISKLDLNGNFIWAKSFGAEYIDVGYFINVDDFGNVYTNGRFGGIVDFDPSTSTYDLFGNFNDSYISKLDSNGNFIWAISFNVFTILPIAIDNFGNIFITGSFSGAVDFDPGPATNYLISMNMNDCFILKLDSSGSYVWARSFGGSFVDRTESIAVDQGGNVYTAGYFGATADFDPGSNDYLLSTNGGGFDVFISKLSASGNFLWAKSMGGIDDDRASSLFIDSNDAVYTIGYFYGTADFDPGLSVDSITSSGSRDIFIHKMSQSITSINELQLNQTIIYPNPTNDELNIQVDNTVIGSTYQLTDITGRPIASGIIKEEKSRISLQGLSSGTYLLSIGDEIRKTLKVVKE